jgi:hypothetical protein
VSVGLLARVTLQRGRLAIDSRRVAVPLGVEAGEQAGTPISTGLSTVSGRVAPICGRVLDRFPAHHRPDLLPGLVGDFVTARRKIVAKFGGVITLIRRAIASLGRLVADVGGLVALVGGAIAPIGATVHGCLTSVRHRSISSATSAVKQ